MLRPLILASTSPRRQSLLAELGIPFTISAPMLEQETLDPALPLAEALEHLALEKARSVARDNPQALVLGADTIVCKDDALLGKPRDAAHAAQMLRTLSGAEHQVITAVALTCAESQKSITCHAQSSVHFRTLSEQEIQDYIASREPLDKAGAYGIQGQGGKFVEKLQGPYDNVVGLPLDLVRQMLAEWEEEDQ